jgi:hypothetical protein
MNDMITKKCIKCKKESTVDAFGENWNGICYKQCLHCRIRGRAEQQRYVKRKKEAIPITVPINDDIVDDVEINDVIKDIVKDIVKDDKKIRKNWRILPHSTSITKICLFDTVLLILKQLTQIVRLHLKNRPSILV